MKTRILLASITLAAALYICPAAMACSSIIISGKYTASGRPVMLKTRDQGGDSFNTNIKYFTGGKYDYISMGPTPWKTADKIRSTGGGMNSAGLCMAGLTSHSFPDDTLKIQGRGSAFLERYALANLSSIEEFDEYLASLPHPLAMRFNLGVIDAHGGAAYYEFGNDKWVKYDVNDPEVAPDGYRCCTNFSFSGDRPDLKGHDRYDDCVAIMEGLKKNADGKYVVEPDYLIDMFGRSFTNVTNPQMKPDKNGMVSDLGLISHRNTSNIIVFEGVPEGTDPKYCIMWTALGHPKCSPAIPLMASHGNTIPEYIDCPPAKFAPIFEDVMTISDNFLYTQKATKGRERYFDKEMAVELRAVALKAEKKINSRFLPLYRKWESGAITDDQFKSEYIKQLNEYYTIFKKTFRPYLY